jgi:hypothetical protein
MNCEMIMPMPPQMSSGRRPIYSIAQKETGVDSTLTSVVTSEMRNGLWMVPSCWKKVVPK